MQDPRLQKLEEAERRKFRNMNKMDEPLQENPNDTLTQIRKKAKERENLRAQ